MIGQKVLLKQHFKYTGKIYSGNMIHQSVFKAGKASEIYFAITNLYMGLVLEYTKQENEYITTRREFYEIKNF